jgi:hypothetical protein
MSFVVTFGSPYEQKPHVYTIWSKRFDETKLPNYVTLNN